MDTVDREFKANIEHWTVIINYCELYPNMLKNKFGHSDGDSLELKQRWQELTHQLNSLGYGKKSMEKWQLAIGRWKSKVKAKATAIKIERQRTGGGDVESPPLSKLEERLMAIMGWRSVYGDQNKEIGMESLKQQLSTQHPSLEQHPSLQATASVSFEAPPPPLQYYNESEKKQEEVRKRKEPDQEEMRKRKEPGTKRKVPQTTDKTRKFVTMSHMHNENLQVLKNIDKNINKLSSTLSEIKTSIQQYVHYSTQNRNEDSNENIGYESEYESNININST